MAGIYLHIPFCKQACSYCDFHFTVSLEKKKALLVALKKEVELQKDYLEGEAIETLYFGGGTPSLLSMDELQQVIKHAKDFHSLTKDAEITLEANPDDLSEEYLSALSKSPVNRLSIGIQSFHDGDLALLNRAHRAEQAIQSVQKAQELGFTNISIDLIYGIPGLSKEKWQANLTRATELNVQHISAYSLTVEPQTLLQNQITKGSVPNVNEEESAVHFEMLMQHMKSHDFIHYEISNFCKEGFHSKHNSSYWLKKKYLGLGPSAHSYNGKERSWNPKSNAQYIQALSEGKLTQEIEELSAKEKYNDYLLTSLRTHWGADLESMEKEFGAEYADHCLKEAQTYLNSKDLILSGKQLFLTEKGKLVADRIISDLFVV